MPIGNEPPLTLTENSRAALKRGSVSWRWLAGAFITGVCGAALIGGALFSSVEGAIHFAEPMRDWSIAKSLDLDMGLGDRNSSTAKSDKLDIARETEVARKVVQISAERQVGKKKFISIRPYELVTIPLATTVSEISDELPPFDPLRIFAAGGIFSADTKAPETETAEKGDAVHIDTVDFADAGDIVFDASDVIAPEEIASVVRDAVPFEIDSKVALTPGPAAAAPADGIAFQGFSPLPGAATFSDANSPVNETTISKTPADPTIEDADSVSVLTVAAGDTLSSLLGKVGIGRAEAAVVAKAMRPVYDPANLQPGQQVNFAVDSDAEGEPRLLRMSLFENGAHLASVKRGKDDGTYLALDASAEIVRPVITAAAAAPSGVRANIYKGLFESGIRNHIPRQILNRIVQVHSYDVDFQRPVQAGDNFSAFFELPDDSGAPPDPLPFYISLTVRGEGHGFYKFRTPDDGIIDYYDDEGRSAKKFLIRKPVNGGRLTSGFGARRQYSFSKVRPTPP